MNHMLFVPANRPERFDKAINSGADAVIIDLEDAVAINEKISARATLQAWLDERSDTARSKILVRINADHTPWHADDVALCRHPNVVGVVVPKAEDVRSLHNIAERCAKPLYPIIETALALVHLQEITRLAPVARLLFGKLDLAVDLGMDYPPPSGEDDAEHVFLFARSQMVLASRAGGLDAPIDGVFTQLNDDEGLFQYARRSARLGFSGVLLVHPRQLSAVRRAYAPTDAQIDWAEKVIAAAQASNGAAVSLDGAMIDAPVIARARTILSRQTE